MKIFYEKLITPIEQSYENLNTIENVLLLEDIIKNYTKDLYLQYKSRTEKNINYNYSDIVINGIIKSKNNIYFINNHSTTYYNYINLLLLEDNYIKIEIANSNLNIDDYKINIYLNNILIESHTITDLYSLYNRKYIQIYSTKLGTSLNITYPLYMNNGEYVIYKFYTINVTENISLHKYLSIFDKNNNCLILDKKYTNNELNLITQSCGSLLRSSTINELYRINSGSFVQYDENTNKLIIPSEQVFKLNNTIKYIREQQLTIDPSTLNSGYNLLGIYLNTNDELNYDIITSNINYSSLLSMINNYQLDNIKKERSYVGFIIGLNNISKFIPSDLQLYNIGLGSGGSGGSANKITLDFTNIEELNIEYVSSTICPIIQIYDNGGNLIIPENIHYNLNNEITINFGELFTGQAVII